MSYTEEDLRQAFYKGREQAVLPDEKGTKLFLRPTFMGYLRELDGTQNPHEDWKVKVQSLIDDVYYDEKSWADRNFLREMQKKVLKESGSSK